MECLAVQCCVFATTCKLNGMFNTCCVSGHLFPTSMFGVSSYTKPNIIQNIVIFNVCMIYHLCHTPGDVVGIVGFFGPFSGVMCWLPKSTSLLAFGYDHEDSNTTQRERCDDQMPICSSVQTFTIFFRQ